MPGVLLSSVEYGGYISVPKFLVFLVLFFLWLLLIRWVRQDAGAVGAKVTLWTSVVFGTGAAGATACLVVPLFAVGVLFYLAAVGTAAVSYVAHRNARVLEYDRVLTADHIKSLLFDSTQKKFATLKNFLFITANNNEIPMPRPKTPDFFGYRATYEILTDAIWRRASKIVFSPTHKDYTVVYEIDGAALKQPSQAREQMEYFIRFVKNLADLDTHEKRKPQKGNFRILRGEEKTEWEVTTAGSTAGEQVTLDRAVQRETTRLPDIGLTPGQHEQLDKVRELKQGLFIVSGPEKSGVTTTFYALLRNHDAFINSINTFERKPSCELPNITQSVFTLSDTGTTTFDKKLRAMLRMGPDIVGVAGCRDTETARIICEASKDAKIMYVILKADSVIKAIGKWVKLVGNKTLATESLLGISNQRLLRKLCDECKQAYAPNREVLRKFSIPAEKTKVLYRAGKVQYDKHGKPVVCENCQGTGFVGRTGVFEIVMVDDKLRKAIKESKSLSEIASQFRSAKMRYLQEQALKKVIDGTTAINEMVRVFSKSGRQKAKKAQQ